MAFQVIRPWPPPCRCACGSNWFREMLFVEFAQPSWRKPNDFDIRSKIEVLECLCGQLFPPPVPPPGFRERDPRTPASLMLNHLQKVEDCSPAVALAHFKSQVAVERAQLPCLKSECGSWSWPSKSG